MAGLCIYRAAKQFIYIYKCVREGVKSKADIHGYARGHDALK